MGQVESDLSPIAGEYRPISACLTQNKARRANKIVYLLLVRDQEVEGSNPFAPTIFSFHGFLSELKRILNCFGDAACAGFGASVVENAEQVPAPA